MIKQLKAYSLTQEQLILLTSIGLTFLYNTSMFTHIVEVYPFSGWNILYIASIGLIQTTVTALFFTLLASKFTTKPLLIITLIISSFTAYFMNNYNVLIDENMIRNALQTNLDESLDLFNFKLLFYGLFLGLLPSYLIYKTPILYRPFRVELLSKIKSSVILIVLTLMVVAMFGKFYTSFFREHKILRFYSNPSFWIDSTRVYIAQNMESKNRKIEPIGLDAKIENNRTRKIVFMIVGEASRADHFSLNGYPRETNPQLSKEDIINFTQMYACGTSTAYSVPCMFSIYNRSNYSYQKAKYRENVLDVLKHTNQVAILWRDNNSDSKGVALRVPYEDFKSSQNNPNCDTECRDIGMLHKLDSFIAKHPNKSILVVLHQMGNHGPAYYKRYTKNFEKFEPVCKSNQFEECTEQSIVNAYDNALLYTDNFLAKTIELAKNYNKSETAVLYMGDHGESLGEHGIYLHGLPYFIAPDAQKHVSSFLWLNKAYKKRVDMKKLAKKSNQSLSHDYLFHTLLGLFDVQTQIYNPKLDILQGKN